MGHLERDQPSLFHLSDEALADQGRQHDFQLIHVAGERDELSQLHPATEDRQQLEECHRRWVQTLEPGGHPFGQIFG